MNQKIRDARHTARYTPRIKMPAIRWIDGSLARFGITIIQAIGTCALVCAFIGIPMIMAEIHRLL